MPHSSGGGSHGGGGHGGGGSHGGGRGVRTSKSYFPGAHKYVYYKNSHPVYYYRSAPIEKSSAQISKKTSTVIVIFMLIVYLTALLGIVRSAINIPKKLNADYDTSIMIVDLIGVLDVSDQKKLEDTFKVFREKTGITPALLCVDNDIWKNRYTDLENFAYDAYVNTFEDEKHWLIVYSQPKNADGWVDWYWEGMQGDDTDNIITSSTASKFNKVVQKNLTDESVSVGDSIELGFEEILPSVMKPSFQPMVVVAFPFIIIHAAFMFYGILVAPAKSRKIDESSIEIKDAAGSTLEDTCVYCRGVYVHGLHFSCPHCGAPIQASNAPVQAADVYASQQPAYAQPSDVYSQQVDDPFAQYDKNDPFADIENRGGFG